MKAFTSVGRAYGTKYEECHCCLIVVIYNVAFYLSTDVSPELITQGYTTYQSDIYQVWLASLVPLLPLLTFITTDWFGAVFLVSR